MKPITSLLFILCLIISTQAAYSPAVAREMAYMSAIAYDSAVSVQAWNCKLCQEYKVSLPKVFLNLTSGVRGFTGYSSSLNSVIVSFKGADSINTFINQLKIAKESFDKCPNCEVSKKFNELYLTVASSILSQIESLRRIYRNSGIYITGHGLGGAFAILAATDIKSLYQSADAVYTFGQPRVGNDQFAAYYSKFLPETYRVINNADIVPHLPALSAGYQHSSFEEWYQNGMTTYKTCEGESASCSNSIPPQSWSINDNSVNAYITIAIVLTQNSPSMFDPYREYKLYKSGSRGVYLPDYSPSTIRVSFGHLLPNLNQVLNVSRAVIQKLLNDRPFSEVLSWRFSKNPFHGLFVLVDSLGRVPSLKDLIEPRCFSAVYLFERVLKSVVELVHLTIASPLLQIYLYSRSIKYVSKSHTQTTKQSDGILLTGMQDFEVILALEDFFDELLNCWKKLGMLLLQEIDVDYEYVLVASKTTTNLDEIYVTILAKLTLQINTKQIARFQDQFTKIVLFFIIDNNHPRLQQLLIPFLLFLSELVFLYWPKLLSNIFARMRTIDDHSRIGKRPKVYLFSKLKQCQLDETPQIDKIVHVYLILGESADETVDLLHAVYEPFLLLEVFFEKIDEFLEILLGALKKDIGTVLRKILLEHSFQRPSPLSQVDMQRYLKNFFVGSTVNQPSDTALKDLLSLLTAVPRRIYLDLQNGKNFSLIQLVHLFERRYAIDVLMFFSIAVHQIFLVEAQLPKTGLKLSKFILICVVKSKFVILFLHQ